MIHCKECRYWQPFEGVADSGICRHSPPGMSADLGIAAWPNTVGHAMCGAGLVRTVDHPQPEPWPKPAPEPEIKSHAH